MTLLLTAMLTLWTGEWADPPQRPAADAISGTWRANLDDGWNRRNGERWVSIELSTDRDRRWGTSIPADRLAAAGIRGERFSGRDIRFTLARDAGRLEFEGSFDNGQGAGLFQFTPSAAYIQSLESSGRRVAAGDALRLAVHDVSLSFIRQTEAQGVKNASIDDLVRMRIHGVDADYIE